MSAWFSGLGSETSLLFQTVVVLVFLGRRPGREEGMLTYFAICFISFVSVLSSSCCSKHCKVNIRDYFFPVA